MGKKTPLMPVILAVLGGGFCVSTGIWLALVDASRPNSGAGIEPSLGNNWSNLWVGIAAGVMILAIILLVRRLRAGKK